MTTWHPLRVAAREAQEVCLDVLAQYQSTMTREGINAMNRIIAQAQRKEQTYAPSTRLSGVTF